MFKTLLIAFIILALFGCGGSGGAEISTDPPVTPKERIMSLETSGVIPNLERENTIAGTDVNSNGIRDDIDTFITSNYTIEEQRAAAMQYAKAMQNSLLVDTSNMTAVKEVNRQGSRANHCLYSKFDGSAGTKQPAQVGAELESITTNTKQRLLAYLAFNKALDGTSWAMPEGDSCE